MSTPTAVERSLAAKVAAHSSWAQTENRSARTAPARQALENKFLAAAGGDPERAAQLREVFYTRLALKSAKSRRKAKEARAQADQLEREAAEAENALTAGGAV